MYFFYHFILPDHNSKLLIQIKLIVNASAQLAVAVEYTDSAEGYDPLPMSILDMTWRSFSNAGALGNVEYPFIAIIPRTTQAQRGCTS